MQAKKPVNYAESDNEESDGDDFVPETKSKRRLKRRRTTDESEDNFSQDEEGFEDLDEGMPLTRSQVPADIFRRLHRA